jgi:lysophospholipase L1-like esterase
MRDILVYGDSNTWGYNPHTKARYPKEHRWPCVLQKELSEGGDQIAVIAEGLNGRTTVWDDPLEGGAIKNGSRYLPACLQSHMPLDLVIIMLGTNDLKHRFSLTAFDIANGAGVLVDLVRASGCGRPPKRGTEELGAAEAPPVLLIAPPALSRLSEFRHIFAGGVEKSSHFPCQYRRVAEERGCALLDAGEFILSSDADGVHFDPEMQVLLGQRVAQRVREMLGP